MSRPAVSKPTADELAVLRRYTSGWALDWFLTTPNRAVEHFKSSSRYGAADGDLSFTTESDGIHATICGLPVTLTWRRVVQVIAAQADNAGRSAVTRVTETHAADRVHAARRPLWRKHIDSAPWTETTGHPIYDTETAWQAALDDWYREAARLHGAQHAAHEAFWNAPAEPADLLDLLDQITAHAEGAHP